MRISNAVYKWGSVEVSQSLRWIVVRNSVCSDVMLMAALRSEVRIIACKLSNMLYINYQLDALTIIYS
jgi:hypothetical protein